MDIKTYSPLDQVDIAVDLGAAPAPLPEILSLTQLVDVAGPPPQQIVEGILHQGCKMVLGGSSKSNKSWCLLDLAISVASGQKWWGRATHKCNVLYINFELHPWAIAARLNALAASRRECSPLGSTLHLWNLRGYNADLTLLRPKLEEQLAAHQFGLIILDPAYKVLGNRDENANGEIAGLMNELEALARSTGAAIVIAHHFAKGDSTVKNAIDRMSGAGSWARDPDSIIVLTPHEEEGCFTVTPILRNLPPVPDFVLSWDFPIMRLDLELDPASLRRPQAKNKVCSDREFIENCLTTEPSSIREITAKGERFSLSKRSVERYLSRLKEADVIGCEYGTYWRKS